MPRSIYGVSVAFALALSLTAQVDNASLTGTVMDASNSAVPGAKVEAVSTATGVRRQTITSTAGTYQIPSLSVGFYKVTIVKEGFRAAEFQNVELTVGQSRTLDAHLSVGTLAESVQVTASADPLNRTSAEVGGLIEASQIKEIPVSGRNWASLMLLAPGAV